MQSRDILRTRRFRPCRFEPGTMSSSSREGELRQNVEYGRVGHFSLQMDAYIPERSVRPPGVILVHGGGWVRGDRRSGVDRLFRPLSAAGFAWFSISYRTVNEILGSTIGAIPNSLLLGGAVQDVRQAIEYVRAHAQDYNTDPNRIALIGESAGAQLASMAALKPGPSGTISAVVAMYGPSDLVALSKSLRQIPSSARRRLVPGTAWADLLLAGLSRLSPINHVRKDMPPFLLIHGTADTLVPFEQSVRMCRKICEAGASCDLYPVLDAGHGMRWWEPSTWNACKDHLVTWLEKQLRA